MPLPENLFQFKHKSFKAAILEFVTLEEYKNIEIEARIGKITSKITKKRLDFRIDHPIIFPYLPNELCFESGVDEKDFKKIKNQLAGTNQLTSNTDKITICNKIRRIELLNDPNAVTFQRKDKVRSLDIFLPDFKYDVRISISTEMVAQPKDFDPRKPQFTRLRKRESLVTGPFVFDFTKVSKTNEKDGKTCEIELEIKDFEESLADFSSIVFSLPLIKMEETNRNSLKRKLN